MEREGPIQIRMEIENKIPSYDDRLELEISDEVYVFYDKTKPGIKFYKKNPEEGSLEGDLIGVPPEGVYYTKEIEMAEWDDEINIPGERVSIVPVRYVNGSCGKVTTIMVTEQEFIDIFEDIRRQEQERKSIDQMIRIDLRLREKLKENIDIELLTKNSLQKMNNENLNEEIKTYQDINDHLYLEDKMYDNKKDIQDLDF